MWWLHLLLQGDLSSCAQWVQPQCLRALPDSFLGAQQTYTCSHSCVGGMKRWSRSLSISWEGIGPIMAEFCFNLYSSMFLGRRPMVQERPVWWHCSDGGLAPGCHPAAGPLDTGGSLVGSGHETCPGGWGRRRALGGWGIWTIPNFYFYMLESRLLNLEASCPLNQLDTKSSVH